MYIIITCYNYILHLRQYHLNSSLVHTSSGTVSHLSWNHSWHCSHETMFSPSFTGSLQWQKTFSVSIFFVLFVHLLFLHGWEMLHHLFLNAVIKMLFHTCHNKKLLFRALFIADSHCECYSKQATVTIIWLLLHIGILKCNLSFFSIQERSNLLFCGIWEWVMQAAGGVTLVIFMYYWMDSENYSCTND